MSRARRLHQLAPLRAWHSTAASALPAISPYAAWEGPVCTASTSPMQMIQPEPCEAFHSAQRRQHDLQRAGLNGVVAPRHALTLPCNSLCVQQVHAGLRCVQQVHARCSHRSRPACAASALPARPPRGPPRQAAQLALSRILGASWRTMRMGASTLTLNMRSHSSGLPAGRHGRHGRPPPQCPACLS